MHSSPRCTESQYLWRVKPLFMLEWHQTCFCPAIKYRCEYEASLLKNKTHTHLNYFCNVWYLRQRSSSPLKYFTFVGVHGWAGWTINLHTNISEANRSECLRAHTGPGQQQWLSDVQKATRKTTLWHEQRPSDWFPGAQLLGLCVYVPRKKVRRRTAVI